MFKTFIKTLRTAKMGNNHPTHHEINKFILELSENKNFKDSLRNLIPNHKLEETVIKELERDYLSMNVMIPIKSYFGDDLTRFGIRKLASNENELNIEIKNNKILKSTVEKLVGFINKHKKLTVGALTLGGIAGYLFLMANKMSGCYKYQILPSSERRLLCKLKSCNGDTLSINDVICQEECVNSLINCSPNTCDLLSGSIYEYRCVTVNWYDALAKLVRELEVGEFLTYIKYFLVFIVALLTLNITHNFNLIPRCFILVSSTAFTYSIIV